MSHEINVRKKLLEVRQTPGQFWLRIACGILRLIAIPLAIMILIIVVGVVQFSWTLAIVTGVIFMSGVMLKYMRTADRLEAALYENGLIYVIGDKVTEVAFKDVKGIQFSVIATANGLKGYIINKIACPVTLLRHDGTKFEMDTFSVVFRSFRHFYQKLDSAFADYLLRDITRENIHQINISFGEHLELKDGCFIHKNPFAPAQKSVMPAENISGVELSFNYLLLNSWLHEGKAIEFANIPLQDMLNLRALYRIVEMPKNQQTASVSNEEHSFGRKLLEVCQTPGQLWLRKARGILLSIAIPFAIVVFILVVFSAHVSWALAIVAAVIIASSSMLILLHSEMAEHLKATLHEDGLVYVIGNRTTKVAFKDVKAARFTAIESAGSLKSYVFEEARPTALIRHNGTRFEMDGSAAVFENFRHFYQKLDSVFADYLLRDVTPENLHQANIYFRERLELKDGCFVCHEKNPPGSAQNRAMPLENISSVERFFNNLLLKSRSPEGEIIEFADIPIKDMLNVQTFYRVVKMTKARQVVNVDSEVHNFGEKLFEVRQTPCQLWHRRFRALLFSGFFPCSIGILLILGGVMGFSLQAVATVLVLAILAALPLPKVLEIKHSEAILYEDGLVYILGDKATKVAFKDVKGTQFTAIMPSSRCPQGETAFLLVKLIKNDDIEVEIDACAAVFESFRHFYQKLDSAFADYLLRDITHENLHKANISFGNCLELRNGQFIHGESLNEEHEDNRTAMPLENLTGITPPDIHSISVRGSLCLKGPLYKGKAINFAVIDIVNMFNIQVLYRIVEMAKARQVANISHNAEQVADVSNEGYNFGKKLFEVRKTFAQLWWRRFWALLLSGFFPCIVGVALIMTGTIEFDRPNVAIIGILAAISALPVFQAIKIAHSEATLHENGLVYILGDKITKVAFEDVKGTQFAITLAGQHVRGSWNSAIIRSAKLIKYDGTKIDMDGCAAAFRNFRQFYERLDSVFADYLLRDITHENLHQANISFGECLELRNGKLIYDDFLEGNDESRTVAMPLKFITGIEFFNTRERLENYSTGVLRVNGPLNDRGEPMDFATIGIGGMLNIQALYRVVEMAKQARQ